MPERRMGVVGVGLILIGFTLQSVQYWAALLDVNCSVVRDGQNLFSSSTSAFGPFLRYKSVRRSSSGDGARMPSS